MCLLVGCGGLCGRGLSRSPLGCPEVRTLLLSWAPGPVGSLVSTMARVAFGPPLAPEFSFWPVEGLASTERELECGGRMDLRTGMAGELAAWVVTQVVFFFGGILSLLVFLHLFSSHRRYHYW